MRKTLTWITIALATLIGACAAEAAEPAAAGAAEILTTPGSGETRALLVIRDGNIAFEYYAPGYVAENRFVSWSMAKTITALALGMLHDEGRIQLDAPAPVPAWRTLTDGREKITVRHLLTMTSGLQHQEGSEGGKPIEKADTVRMLFSDGAQHAAAYAIARPLSHPPGTHWQYSTATTHILADIITNLVSPSKDPAERRRAVADWFMARMWAPLGITSAEWDFDNAGLFLGGSMIHMTARDYARLGQFMLDRGTTRDGRRLVSEAWLTILMSQAAAINNNHYAGQLWLNTGPASNQQPVLFHPKGGADTTAMIGHLGQYIIAVPSKRSVIVRLGKSNTGERAILRASMAAFIDALP